jgi:hypothetical protein
VEWSTKHWTWLSDHPPGGQEVSVTAETKSAPLTLASDNVRHMAWMSFASAATWSMVVVVATVVVVVGAVVVVVGAAVVVVGATVVGVEAVVVAACPLGASPALPQAPSPYRPTRTAITAAARFMVSPAVVFHEEGNERGDHRLRSRRPGPARAPLAAMLDVAGRWWPTGPGSNTCTLDAVRLAQFGRWRRFTFTNAAGQQATATVSARDRILSADRRLGRWAGLPIGMLLDHARRKGWTWTVEDDDTR